MYEDEHDEDATHAHLDTDTDKKPETKSLSPEEAIDAALKSAPNIRENHGIELAGMKQIAGTLKDVAQKYLLPEQLAALLPNGADDIEDFELDVRAIIGQLAQDCPELRALSGHLAQIDIVWFTHVRKSLGQVLRANARKRRAAEIDTGASWWELELSLAGWMLLSIEEKQRVVYEQLLRFWPYELEGGGYRPRLHPKGHKLYAVWGRFGPLNLAEAAAIENGKRHPRFEQKRQEYAEQLTQEVIPGAQLDWLFPAATAR